MFVVNSIKQSRDYNPTPLGFLKSVKTTLLEDEISSYMVEQVAVDERRSSIVTPLISTERGIAEGMDLWEKGAVDRQGNRTEPYINDYYKKFLIKT